MSEGWGKVTAKEKREDDGKKGWRKGRLGLIWFGMLELSRFHGWDSRFHGRAGRYISAQPPTKILCLSHQITPVTDPEYPKQCLMYLQDRGKVGLRSLLPALLSKVQVRNAKSLVVCVMLPWSAAVCHVGYWDQLTEQTTYTTNLRICKHAYDRCCRAWLRVMPPYLTNLRSTCH